MVNAPVREVIHELVDYLPVQTPTLCNNLQRKYTQKLYPSKHLKVDHFRVASKRPFECHFIYGPMET